MLDFNSAQEVEIKRARGNLYILLIPLSFFTKGKGPRYLKERRKKPKSLLAPS